MSRNVMKRRLTLGLLVDWAEVEYQMKIIFGAIDAAKAHDINLLCIEGGNIHSKRESDQQRNILYDFLGENDVDGLIILAGSVGYYATPEQILQFANAYRPLPMVSIVREIEGCGLVKPDNSSGLRDLLVHMIEVHQYGCFAVITCAEEHPSAKIRLETIRKTLQEYRIELDEEMVVSGEFNWSPASGREAVRTLLDERKVKFDAIIAVNDNLAWGALEELQARDIRVPEDIAVIGFDNFDFSAHSSPPLSTVSQPLYEQGARAVEHLLDLVQKKETPKQIVVPTEMVIRESCGCRPQSAPKSILGKINVNGQTEADSFRNREEFIADAVKHIESALGKKQGIDLHELVETFVDALRGADDERRGEFFRVCYLIYQQTVKKGNSIVLWENILSELRCCILSSVTDYEILVEIEDLFHQAQAVIADKAIQKEQGNNQAVMSHNVVLNRISEELLSTFSVKQLVKVLANRLPELGITSGFIIRFEEGRHKHRAKRELILAYNKRGRIKLKDNDCDNEHLVPPVLFNDGEQHCQLITLLTFSKMRFGIMGIELDLHNAFIYGALRRIVCSSLHSVILNNLIKEREKRLVAQEYAKNLEQMKKAMEGIINTILLTTETRDPYTAGHQNRVADLATAIAIEMKIPPETVEGIRMAGIVHDVGKISVPTEILNKPGRLRKPEFELIKEHSQFAYDILKNLEFPWPIGDTILQHHERLDGSGYPKGLMGDQIKLEARILGVADVIEAMASHRPYRPALGIDKALEEISEHRGSYYEPDVVDACVKLFKEKGYQLP